MAVTYVPGVADAFLTTAVVAPQLGMTEAALVQARHRGRGPKYVRVGARSIRYRASDVASYIAEADSEAPRSPGAAA